VGAGALGAAVKMDRFLEGVPKSDDPPAYLYLYTLLHSYARLVMKQISEYSGLDLGSLGEYVFPADLAFVVYRNGTTMDLGNLSAMWRNSGRAMLAALLPEAVVVPLRQHLPQLYRWYLRERQQSAPGVSLPPALRRKYPAAPLSWPWQYVFPSATVCTDPHGAGPLTPPLASADCAAGGQGSRCAGRHRQAGRLSYLSALLCHPFAAERL
jgi:hypothetical protein